MTDSMVERVSAAIAKASPFVLHAPTARIMARAAIEAMREPTEAMSDALERQLSVWVNEVGSNEDVYIATVDAALSQAQPTGEKT